MATLKDFRDERLRKLEDLKELGFNPYPADSHRTHDAGTIIGEFEQLENQTVTVAGRITAIRKFGKLAFIVVKDFSGSVQLYLNEADVEARDIPSNRLGIEDLPLLDTGDFIEAVGSVGKSKTGEVSVFVKQLRLLTKTLRPMPSAQEGFTNKEERMRRRYVDMNVNQEVRDRFVRRSKFWQATRDFMISKDFIEISNSVLEATAGGADANPFVTHMDALDQDFYLRISQELPLKRLLVAGFEKNFEIGPRFRNENYSDEHLPEHNAMEWYWAYADWEMGMALTEEMIRYIADTTWGTRQFTLSDGKQVDFGNDGEHFEKISFVEILKSQYGIDVFDSTMEAIQAKLKEEKLEVEKTDNRNRSLDKLWKKYRKTIAGPVFLIDMPVFMQPLAKTNPKDTRLTEQFNLVFGGSEMCKAFSELNDPIDQLNRFLEQQDMRDAGDDEAQMLDIDFVEALEYGMPPACGLGFSERIFWSLEGVSAREGVPFPHLKTEIDETTKSIYPDVKFD
jgi:lysyl-tRNA synthetase class 2